MSFENKNPNFHTNGENWLWGKLKNLKFDCIFDVGANIGEWSIGASEEFKANKIFAFEPIPRTYDLLVKNIVNHNIQAINIALSNINGEIEFYFSFERSYLSTSLSKSDDCKFLKTICPVQRGDDFCQDLNIENIDFLKIDTEGNDFKVLKGFEDKIKKNQIRLIQFEYGPFAIDSKDLLKDFYDLLNQYGYIICKIYPNHIELREFHIHSENFILSNYIAFKRYDLEMKKLLLNN